jgi:VanZ family protein
MIQWLPFIVYATLIFYISSQPYIGIPEGILLLDPERLILHILEYLPLGILAARAVSKTQKLSKYNQFNSPLLIGAVYGLSDEAHQYFIPGRTPSVFDFMADALGVFLGVIIWIVFLGEFFKKRRLTQTLKSDG